ncbi:MAG TPA: DUF1684 domain-containing protein [Pyrinomonadaceae bacterium]|jgi:hypothetical protein|nr:DUF1684 domain-containing protein [Pyrinomonadaceae bacterium]
MLNRTNFIIVLGGALMFLVGCGQKAETASAGAHAREVEEWRAQRLASLKSEDGWLTLVGLYWLKEGENRFGADEANDLVLPAGKAPARAGSLFVSGKEVRVEAREGSGLTHDGTPVNSLRLKSDAGGEAPTILKLGSLSLQVIERGGKLGLRVKDRESEALKNFRGLDNFPADARWRFEARFERFDPPRSLPITNVLGWEEDTPSPGAVVFEAGGKTYRLDAISEPGEPRLFIIFADATSGRETYGAGRYLYADPPDASGKVVVDFNKAYSPPCAFTSFATCPLPPEQNKLPLRVEAGEKFAGH